MYRIGDRVTITRNIESINNFIVGSTYSIEAIIAGRYKVAGNYWVSVDEIERFNIPYRHKYKVGQWVRIIKAAPESHLKVGSCHKIDRAFSEIVYIGVQILPIDCITSNINADWGASPSITVREILEEAQDTIEKMLTGSITYNCLTVRDKIVKYLSDNPV